MWRGAVAPRLGIGAGNEFLWSVSAHPVSRAVACLTNTFVVYVLCQLLDNHFLRVASVADDVYTGGERQGVLSREQDGACAAAQVVDGAQGIQVYRHAFDAVAGEGDEEEANDEALRKVEKAIGKDPDQTRTITLSCGRLTTGVSVKPWTGVFMLSGSFNTAASAYMQTIFRVQTPATINL